jgi:DNA-binding response OmpR family regulator
VKILVCEDEPEVASFLKDALGEVGYLVDVSAHGQEALSALLAEDYDAAVLDVMLPGIDGMEVVRRARARHVTTPILLLTARFRVDDRIEGLDAGADDYMVKPFALGELLARVRALLRRPVAEVPVLKAGKLELDPATRRVTYKGSLVFLSATEFSLLQYLLRNRGRVLSKSQILDHVWDDQGYRSANTVEVYVNYLRSKISPRLIKTVRGVGYVIGEEDEA